jgi:hypothetical protein
MKTSVLIFILVSLTGLVNAMQQSTPPLVNSPFNESGITTMKAESQIQNTKFLDP